MLAACGEPQTTAQLGPLVTPAAAGAAQPGLASAAGTSIILSWQESDRDGAAALRYSTFADGRFGPVRTVAEGSNWFINWADTPSVIPLDASRLIAHWLPLQPDERYAYDIAFIVSDDGGQSWSEISMLNADGAVAEHGFVSFFDWGGDIGAVWLDGREIAALTIDEFLALEEPVGMTLRFARIDARGRVVERGEIDELVCDCCRTAAVATATGPLIVYRDRSDNEVRDIVVRHALAAGETSSSAWSEARSPGADGWAIDGCPVNGPAIAATGDHVALAWFTAADDQPRLRFTRSQDAGRGFEQALTIADQAALGQVDVVLHDDGTAWVSAWHRTEFGSQLRVHRFAVDSQTPHTRVVADSEYSLPVDVPQMALSGEQLLLVWTELGNQDEPGGLQAATIPAW